MNTPRSRPLKRFGRDDTAYKQMPDGKYAQGLTHPEMLQAVGAVVTSWPHLEEAMIQVLGSLLGSPPSGLSSPARQVFRSIVSTEAKIKVMRALLEQALTNVHKGQFYDDVIDEFASLNGARNGYVHGIWTTHNDKDVYLDETTTDDFLAIVGSNPRKIQPKEVWAVVTRIHDLTRKILIKLPFEHAASPETPSPQAGEGNP